MRIVQIIDSLEVGGAEKMAINYANALSKRVDFSGLVAVISEKLAPTLKRVPGVTGLNFLKPIVINYSILIKYSRNNLLFHHLSRLQ